MAERQRITLVCSVCQARNYQTTKAPRRVGVVAAKAASLELQKFCKHCDKHTLHRESK